MTQTVVMCGDLQPGIKMVSVASNGGFKVGEGVIEVVEVHVVEATLVPRCGVIRRLPKCFVEGRLGSLGAGHALVARRQLRQCVRVVRCGFQNVLEFL